MVKKSLIWLYSAVTYVLWTGIIVVAVIVLGLRYYVLPHATDYRETIAQHASAALGQHVTIGNMKAGWHRINPHLDLQQINIDDKQGRPALQFDHIEASLSWISLLVGEPRLESLVIHQPQLTIRRAENGEIFVAGISLNAPARPEFPNWLLRQNALQVSDATIIWQDDMQHAPPLKLEKLNFLLERSFAQSFFNLHQFGLTAVPSVGDSRPIDIRGSFYGGDVTKIKDWHGRLYAAIDGSELSSWRTWFTLPQNFQHGFGAMRMWLDFADHDIKQVTADIALHDVVTQLHADKPVLSMQQVSGRIAWQRLNNGGYELDASRLSLDAEHGLKIANGTFNWKEDTAKKTGYGGLKVDALALEPVMSLVDYLPLNDQQRQQLISLSPAGNLNNLKITWQDNYEVADKYSMQADFKDLSIQPVKDLPGFSGFSGHLDADQDKGTLQIDTRNAALNLPEVFRQPIPANTLTAQIAWKQQGSKLNLTVSKLNLTNPHLNGLINATYRYDGVKGGFLDLTGDVRNVNGKFAHFYYPLVLGKDTLNWLDSSILQGHSDDVKVKIKGYVDDFPYIGGKDGEFSVTASIRDGVIDYAKDWPKVDNVSLKMKFYENKMLLTEAQGQTLGTQVSNTTVRINDLDADHPVVEIDGHAQNSVEDGLRFIEQSPISASINHFTDGMKGSGTGKLALKLVIPADNPDATRVNGSYIVTNGGLKGDEDWPPLDHINGTLAFTENTIKADRVQAQIYGGPVSFNMSSGANGKVDIQTRGRMTSAGFKQLIPHQLSDRLAGQADWQGHIALLNKHTNFVIDFPDLVGFSSTLPAPFDKTADAKVPLHIERKLTGDGDFISVNYGGGNSGTAEKALSVKLARSIQNGVSKLDRSDIRFGGDPHPASLAPGITVGGSLAYLDADQWLAILGSDKQNSSSVSSVNLASSAKLKIGTLDIFSKRINNLQVDARSDSNNTWRANVSSREITGDLTWAPQGSGHITANLDSLIIPETAPGKSDEDTEPVKEQKYPSITLTANQFQASGKKLGKLELRATQQGRNWNIEALRMENPDFVANMSGAWSSWRRNSNTLLNVDMTIADIGKTLDRFGYPGTIKSGSGSISGNLSWPNGPQAFSPETLSGNLTLKAEKGQFLKIQSGVGKLLGIISLQSLPRRLLLDFRDVFSSGFSFDKISSDIFITQGVMRSENFVMQGPAARVNMNGETDLAKETQHLHIKVTPAVSDSFSLAAFAGGPAVGLAAILASKILQDPLNKIAAYEYDIVGTWDDPQEVKSNEKTKAATPAFSPMGK
jgi:uncharacterized protein (TIGR02099 family)